MERNLALEVVRVTEAAALLAGRYMGRGDASLASRSALDAMKKIISSVAIKGTIICGKVDSDEDSMIKEICIDNENGIEVDVLIDPVDGRTTCASGGRNAISAISIAEKGSFFDAPRIYMEKIAVGAEAKGAIDITESPAINIKRVARAMNKYIDDVTVCILERPRHKELIEAVRGVGARIMLIRDGDVSGAVAAAMSEKQIDILMGVGGAMEGIMAAAAIKCLGGDIQARFVYRDDEDRKRVQQMGEEDLDRIYFLSDLVKGDNIMFSATGVTDGELLFGVRFYAGGAETNSIVMRSKTHTLRFITARHQFDYKPMY
ncbi:MAG: class II fructose-bisphosphatase [Spirochaetota bacterium]|nr:class II fructose-bisphosphatase [Spirochaetota bacterium]